MELPAHSTLATSNAGPEMARAIRDVVGENAAASERERTLTKEIVKALWDSGLMQLQNPVAAGGQEPSVPEMLEVWEELAWQDASLGWIGIANLPVAAFAAAYLPDQGFEEIFTAHDNRVTLPGQFAPVGQGRTVPGGYEVRGSWSFGSGTGYSKFVVGGFMPFENGVPRMQPNGLPEMLVAVFPRDQIELTDPSRLAEKPTFQRGLAHHEGMWRAARHQVFGVNTEVWEPLQAGGDLTPTMLGLIDDSPAL